MYDINIINEIKNREKGYLMKGEEEMVFYMTVMI